MKSSLCDIGNNNKVRPGTHLAGGPDNSPQRVFDGCLADEWNDTIPDLVSGTDNEWLARTPPLRNQNSWMIRRCPPTSPTVETIKRPYPYCCHSCPARAIVLSRSHCTRETKKTSILFQATIPFFLLLSLHDRDLHYPPSLPQRYNDRACSFSRNILLSAPSV
jgi:hypothetical protein